MGHRLPSYNGICASPHGHNVRFEVEIETGNTFLDFKTVAGVLKEILEPLDHAMVLYEKDPFVPLLQQLPDARIVLVAEEPTTEFLSIWVGTRMACWYRAIRCTVYETDKYSATYRYGA
jgi:6-pyruvoyl-tetrahydropterin synthase